MRSLAHSRLIFRMNWQLKAAIQRVCNAVPFGKQTLYRQLQRHCGGLVKGYDPGFLLSEAARMVSTLSEAGFDVEGAGVMEVGTGWRVDMPLGFYLCGARRIVTCDLNRYLDERLTLQSAQFIAANAERVQQLFSFLDPRLLESRIKTLRDVNSAEELFLRTGIEYHAPSDCASTGFEPGSIDLHYSYTVFEHIAAPTLEAILREANRLLSDRGLAFHHIDLGDHFAQVDPSITPANFLQFSERDWQWYAGTPWSYHNRLREDEYRALFQRAAHEILEWKPHVDEASLDSLRNGFPLAPQFRGRPAELLSVAILDVISRPRRDPPLPPAVS